MFAESSLPSPPAYVDVLRKEPMLITKEIMDSARRVVGEPPGVANPEEHYHWHLGLTEASFIQDLYGEVKPLLDALKLRDDVQEMEEEFYDTTDFKLFHAGY